MRAWTGQASGNWFFWLPFGIILISGAILLLLVLNQRTQALDSGERLTQVFARLAEDQATHTLQSLDQVLHSGRHHLAGRRGNLPQADAEHLLPEFKAFVRERPFMRGIFVLDASGRLVLDTGGAPLGQDLSDRPYFRHHQEQPADHFEVHRPVTDNGPGLPMIVATRPWLRADGAFAGVVGGTIDPAFFAAIWQANGRDGGNFISLLRRDGTMLVRSPYQAPVIGRSFADSPVFAALAQEPTGTLHPISPVDGLRRVLTYRSVRAYPHLVVIVSQTTESVLADWRRFATIAGTGWTGGSVVLLALAFWLRQEWQRRAVAEQELAVSAERLTAIMDHTVDGLVVIDETGIVRSFSKPAEAIFGYAAAEVIGRNVKMLMPEPYRTAHDDYLRNYLRSGRARIIGIGREVQGRRKDGTFFPMDLAVGEIPPTQGQRHFVGTVRDISARKSTEEQLRQAQKMEAVGQLTGGVAHDFNNMLAVILGNVEMLREVETDPQKAALLETATRAGERGAELTHRLLAFSRRQTLVPQTVELNQLIQDTVKLLKRTLGENISVETRLDPQPLFAVVDVGQLENALLNLAINARDAMPSGGRLSLATGSVTLEEEIAGSHADVAPGSYRIIAVSDNGSGMTPEVKARVFEPFFTTKQVGKGSGLGLSMVYGFIKQSGGHVTVYSEPGHGTTIRLYLPIGEEDAGAETKDAAPLALDGAGQTVLVVEDEDDVRALVAGMVERLGYTPVVARDGHEAMALLDATPGVQIMISDVIMPSGMSGVELASIARGSRPGLPVIFMSGYSDETDALADVVRSGGKLLGKPFSRAQLAAAIHAVLGGR